MIEWTFKGEDFQFHKKNFYPYALHRSLSALVESMCAWMLVMRHFFTFFFQGALRQFSKAHFSVLACVHERTEKEISMQFNFKCSLTLTKSCMSFTVERRVFKNFLNFGTILKVEFLIIFSLLLK